MHARTEGKYGGTKDSFHEELERVFDTIPDYHVTFLLGYFCVKVWREDIFKRTVVNEN
jgi:hypothetical protein